MPKDANAARVQSHFTRCAELVQEPTHDLTPTAAPNKNKTALKNKRARKREEQGRPFHALRAQHERFDANACWAQHLSAENERQERALAEEARFRAEWERCMAKQREREAVGHDWELVPTGQDDEWEVVVATGEAGQ